MGNFSSPKKNRCFHLVAVFQETLCMFFLEFVVVLVSIGAKLNFFHLNSMLLLLGLRLFLFFMVSVFTIIYNLTYRWLSAGRD